MRSKEKTEITKRREKNLAERRWVLGFGLVWREKAMEIWGEWDLRVEAEAAIVPAFFAGSEGENRGDRDPP